MHNNCTEGTRKWMPLQALSQCRGIPCELTEVFAMPWFLEPVMLSAAKHLVRRTIRAWKPQMLRCAQHDRIRTGFRQNIFLYKPLAGAFHSPSCRNSGSYLVILLVITKQRPGRR